MGNIRFETIVLSPDQVRQNVRPDDFPESGRISGTGYDFYSGESSRYFVSWARIPSAGSLRVEVDATSYYDVSVPRTVRIFLRPTDSLYAQASRDCAHRGPYLFAKDQLWSAEVPLPARAMVTGVFQGDYNADGRADFMVTLSNGGAIVFQQAGDELPELECRSRRWPRPLP
jgi:hypothetical protein